MRQFDRETLLLRVRDTWIKEGFSLGTIANYLFIVRCFGAYCERRRLDEIHQLTRAGVTRFARAHIRQRGLKKTNLPSIRGALHRWAETLGTLGLQVPDWNPNHRLVLKKELTNFREHLLRVRGVGARHADDVVDVANRFLAWQSRSGRTLRGVTIQDVDRFLKMYGRNVGWVRMWNVCTALRKLLRFLHAEGRVAVDLSSLIVGPSGREKPPRALPWADVTQILKSIDRSSPLGLRDYALLLTMVGYGFGSAEVLSLTLDSLDWCNQTLRLVRPKTKEEIILPLTGPVGRALSAYIRAGRPRGGTSRSVFLRSRAPFSSIGSSNLRHILRQRARDAGVKASDLGAHVLRHSHATKQVELAAPPKVVSDILGHRSPASLSTYARVARERLRSVSLRPPRA